MLVLIKIVQQGIVVELSPFLPHGWCCCDGLCGLPPCLYSRGVLANLANLCRNRLGSHKPLNWCEIYDLKVFMNEYNQSRGEGSIAWCLDEEYGETIWLSFLPYIRGPFVSSASFAIFSHPSLSLLLTFHFRSLLYLTVCGNSSAICVYSIFRSCICSA